MRNTHKTDAKVINLPTEQLAEDRGYKFCGKPYLTFANPENGSISWQNDLFSVAFIADDIEVILEKDGQELPAFGINLDFPFQPDAVGFMILWREVLINHGTGCYKVKANYTLQGFEFTLHYGSFDLMPYSVEASESTIRVLGQYNDEVKMYGINFAGSNFARTFRVKGNLHNEQPNTEHGNILKGDDKFAKYRNHGQISYDLETAPLVACELDPLFEIIIASNRIYLSDFNRANFRQYRDVEVVLRDDDEISYGEQFGHERQLLAPFKQKQWLIESKYSEGTGEGQIFTSGLDFTNIVSASGTNNIQKSDGTLIESVTVPSGGTVNTPVPDSPITVNGEAYTDLKATDSLNIPIVDSNGDAVNTTVVGSDVQVDDLPCATPTDEWIRPADWLDMPTVAPTDDTFVALHAVFPSGQNFAAFRFSTDSGDYQVDWGDGTITTHASNTVAEHIYDYTTYDPTDSTLSSRGYKQAIIEVTPVSGALTLVDIQRRYTTSPIQNQRYATGFLDIAMSTPSHGVIMLVGGVTVRHSYCERVVIRNFGNATNLNSLFLDFYSLRVIELADTSAVTTMQFMFRNCFSLPSVPLFDTSNVTNMFGMFLNCSSLQNVPLFDTSSVTNMQAMFSGCSSLQSVPLFDTSSVTNMASMFNGCSSLQSVPLFDTSSATTMNNTFNGCNALNVIPALNTGSVTNMGNFATNCNSLDKSDIICPVSVNFNNCQLSQSELVNIFNNLVDRTATTAANINISGNWGASALTTAERDIALNKNWTITG